MRIWPLLFDSRPGYLGASSGHSLLALPLGNRPVVARLSANLAKVTPNAPTIVVSDSGVALDRQTVSLGGGFFGSR